ncbi:MAG: DUF5698 domain-containing protein [Thermoanaerobacterales bacterium]|nr:DUF5698 domain-containing protein [Bacillota bacterium]MDI6905922.1 DUF5698 domain-containing protein [Thermoanaerobacterales bacterium]
MGEILLGYLLIFGARVADVSLDVIRILLLTRGRRLWASLVGFTEVGIFIMVLNFVLRDGLTDPGKIIAYAAGFATGNYLGSLIEERLAMGYLSIQVFPSAGIASTVIQCLRDAGFGVTVVTGEGRSGPRPVLFVFIKRRDLPRALDILESCEPDIFFNVSDARSIHGGVFPQKMAR